MSTKIQEPAVETPTPTEAELEQSRRDFVDGFGFGDPKAKVTETPKEEKPAPAPEPKAEEPKDEKKEPVAEPEKQKKPKPKKSELVRPEIEPERQADIDEDALAERIANRIQASAKPEPQEDLTLTPEETATLTALDRLSKDPKYTGRDLVKETKAFWNREQDYASKWESENPGQDFDATDPEHKAFYARHEPKYVPKDLEAAKQRVQEEAIEQRIEESVKRKVDPQLDQIRAREEFRRVQPEIERATHSAIAEMVAAAVPDFKEHLSDGDGGLAITQEALEKMTAAHPEAVELLNEEANGLRVTVSELEKLTRLGNLYFADLSMKQRLPSGEFIKPHQAIMDAGIELETAIQGQPAADQLVDGRKFITRAELFERQSAILDSNESKAAKKAKLDALTNRVWFVEPGHIRERLVNKSAARVSKILGVAEKIKTRLAAKSADSGKNGNQSKPAETKQARPSTPAPAIVASSDNVDTGNRVNDDGAENRQQFAAEFFG